MTLIICLFSLKLLSYTSTTFLNANGVTGEMMDQEEFPVSHWIMMALNPANNGGYEQKDVEYTIAFKDKNEKTKATMKKLYERVDYLGIKGMAYHVLVKKVLRMWSAGDCSAADYSGRKPLNKNILREFLNLDGKYSYFYLVLSQGYYIILLWLIGMGGLKSLLELREEQIRLFKLVFLGVFFFFLNLGM